jgi:shikimate kinase
LKKRSGKPVGARKRSGVLRRPPSLAAARDAVFLVGFMGAGKSSVGRALGERLNWLFEDLDDRIERCEDRKIAEIFENSGEPYFRQAERAALRQVLGEMSGAGQARIVALGGGAFAQKDNAALLKAAGAPTVFLDAPVEELWQRCRGQATESGLERPLLRDVEQFGALYRARRKHYSTALLTIGTGGREVKAIAAEIAKKLGLKKIAMRTEQGESE